jgi:hypothetical protein
MFGRSKSILLIGAIPVAIAIAAGAALAQQATDKGGKAGEAGKPGESQKKAKADHDKLLAEADRIAAKVSRLRGLAIRRPIKRGVMSKPQITKRLMARVQQEYAPDEIASEELAMKRLGLLPPDADYLKLVIDLLTDQIAGFYDPWEQELYIADWMMLGRDDVMAHEIDHALQDQHFHLRTWMAAEKKNADATVARQALVEGDGLAVMIEFSSPTPVPWGRDGFVETVTGVMSMGAATLGDVPLVIKEGLVFPYSAGLRFVAEVRKTRPWKAVDEIYRKPPLSSEHILHPHTYARYERPVAIGAGSAAGLRAHKKRYDNVLGQFGLSILLRQHKVSLPIANLAAAGWGGDRLTVYSPTSGAGASDRTGASAVAIIYTVWDSEVDAIEFFGAFEDAMPSLAGNPTVRKPELVEVRSGATSSSVERRRDAVLVVLGAPGDAAALRGQVWKSWSVRRPKASQPNK